MNDGANVADQKHDPSLPKAERVLIGHFLRRESPFVAMLLLAMLGVAYTTYSGQPIILYWGVLGPVFGAICVANGWRRETEPKRRWGLVWTQAAHWAGVVAAMYLVLVPQTHSAVGSNAVGLNLMSLLALGTFTSGLHSRAWSVCAVGAALALAIPAVASIEQFTLLIFVVAAALFGIVLLFWWLQGDQTVEAR